MARRIDWFFVIDGLGLMYDFKIWCNKKKRNISLNRLGYSFLKHLYGQKWIDDYKKHPVDLDEIIRIAKTPWIKLPEE